MRKYKRNTILFTKDGSVFGNAIIIGFLQFPENGYKIKTDYGNIVNLIEKEIEDQFTIGRVSESHKHSVYDYRQEFKGTSGEWTVPHFVSEHPTCDCGFVLNPNYGGAIATVHFNKPEIEREDNPPLEEAIYNAKLIAHAPQMLILLQRLTDTRIMTPMSNPHPIKSEIKQLLKQIL